MAVVMYRFETYVKEKAIKETRSDSYILDKYWLSLLCSKFAHSKHAQYKLVPSPLRSYARERGWNWKAGTRELKISKASNG